MSKLENTFRQLKEKGQKALIPYIMAGDPNLETTAELLKALPAAGADIIELGMPFTDPMADGPVIQDAANRALDNNVTLKDILNVVRDFREANDHTPLVLMGYFNPIFAYGVEKFCKDASDAGVSGLLIVDIPPEEGNELWPDAKSYDLDIIRMVTPTSKGERLDTIVREASGFLYYVSITGITGTASATPEKIAAHMVDIREASDLPVVVGFGIKTPEDAAVMSGLADGAVVGSALVHALTEGGAKACLDKVSALKNGMDAPHHKQTGTS